jgi:hypothetical protein
MTKKVLLWLGIVGLLALSVREFPAVVREIKILRMGSAPQGPTWHQRAGGG